MAEATTETDNLPLGIDNFIPNLRTIHCQLQFLKKMAISNVRSYISCWNEAVLYRFISYTILVQYFYFQQNRKYWLESSLFTMFINLSHTFYLENPGMPISYRFAVSTEVK